MEEIDILDQPAEESYEHFRCVVDPGQVAIRIDKYLFERMVHSSRNRIQTAAEAGCICVNDKAVKRYTPEVIYDRMNEYYKKNKS